MKNSQLHRASLVYSFMRKRISLSQEEFWAVALNSNLEALDAQCLFRGTVDHCLIHPRDIFRYAFTTNASRLILSHSHPSGQALPSKEDLLVTQEIVEVSRVMKVPIEDHLIVAEMRYFSFKEKGLL